jgi:hypothetical protein
VAFLMIRCRYTGESFFSGIETDAKNFNRFPNVPANARCPHCELDHTWWKHEAWLSESPTGEAELQHSKFGWQLARIYWSRTACSQAAGTPKEAPRSMGDRAAGPVGRWENVNATDS